MYGKGSIMVIAFSSGTHTGRGGGCNGDKQCEGSALSII